MWKVGSSLCHLKEFLRLHLHSKELGMAWSPAVKKEPAPQVMAARASRCSTAETTEQGCAVLRQRQETIRNV